MVLYTPSDAVYKAYGMEQLRNEVPELDDKAEKALKNLGVNKEQLQTIKEQLKNMNGEL